MPAIVELSQADYAKRRRLTPKAIEKAIKAGRIPASAVRRAGRKKLIDVAAADLAWPLSNVRINSDVAAAVPGETADGTAAEPAAPPALTLARTEGAQIDARMKALALEQRLGNLVEVADVTRSMEICAAALVRDLEQLPARADDIATAMTRNGVDGVRSLLKQIVREIRGTIANNMRLVETDDAEIGAEITEDVAA